jgi:hypothetical protein
VHLFALLGSSSCFSEDVLSQTLEMSSGLQEADVAGPHRAVLDYPLHPGSLRQLQELDLPSSQAGAGASMLRGCSALLAALQLDSIQDAAMLAAAKAAQPSVVQTSYMRHLSTAVSVDSCKSSVGHLS